MKRVFLGLLLFVMLLLFQPVREQLLSVSVKQIVDFFK